MSVLKTVLAASALITVGSVSTAAAAAPLSPAEVMALPKASYQRLVEASRKQAKTKRASERTTDLDTTGPKLKELNLSSSANAQQAGERINYSFSATDDLSGVRWIGFVLTGPSGQQWTAYAEVGMPRTKASGRGGMGVSQWAESGEWIVTEVRGGDANNNYLQDPGDLSALGNVRVQVRNTGGTDKVAPTLVSGQVLTPAVSLSQPPNGTEYGGPFVAISVQVQDGGNSPSGVSWFTADFCDQWDSLCLSLNAQTNARVGVKNVTLQPYTVADEVMTPAGRYRLSRVTITDTAGNTTQMVSTHIGGDTDFSLLFPSTTIDLNP